MKEVKESIVQKWIAQMIIDGQIIPNDDGTFELSEELKKIAQKMLNEHPELYPKIFPERVN